MPVKTVIFDFDGTLADTGAMLLSGLNKYSKKYGYDKIQDLESLRNIPLKKLIREELKLPRYKLPQYSLRLRKFIKKQEEQIVFFSQMKELLSTLSEKYRVGIVSSNSKKLIERTLKRLDVHDVSFVHCTKSLFDKHKTLLKILKKKKLKSDETIYVGDEARDIKACQKISIKMIAVTWGFDALHLLQKEQPDFLAQTPSELMSLLVG